MELLRAFRYARRYENWRDILVARRSRRYPRSVTLRDGHRFEAPEDVNPARCINGIYFKHSYSPDGFDVGEDDVVVDVGANIGVFTVYAACRTRRQVVAIEPCPQNVQYLKRNLLINKSKNVSVVPFAASDRHGTAELFLNKNGVLHQLFRREGDGQLRESINVPTAPLEYILKYHGVEQVDVLKMDCEGAEGLILRAASKDFLSRVRRIVMEFHDHASPLRHDEICTLLQSHGFKTKLRWDGRSETGLLYASH